MGITCIIVGLFFLLNPNVVLIDVLPDFIGTILILIGISKIARLNLTLRDAFTAFRNLLILNLVKLPALWIYLSFAGGSGDVWGLLFTFGFGFFEAFFAVRAFRDLFDGLTALSNARSGEDVLLSPVFQQQKEVRLLTYLFMIAKPAFAALPELANLSSEEFGTVTANGIESMARYRMLFTVVAAGIVLILGIAWFVSIANYFRRIGTDRAFLDEIDTRYQREILSDPVKTVTSRIFIGLNLLIAAALFSLEFKFDGFNDLPHPIFLAIILFVVLYLRSVYPVQCKKAACGTVAAIIGSTLAWVYTFSFVYSFYSIYLTDSAEGAGFSVSAVLETKLLRDFNIMYGFWGMIAATVLDGALFIWVLFTLRGLLLTIIKDHTGGTIAPDGHLIGGGNLEKNTKPARDLLNAVVAVGAISAVSGVAQTALLPYLPEYWMADMAIRICFVVLFILLIGKIRADMKDRYEL